MRWTAADIADVVDGRLHGPSDAVVERVTQDSRDISPASGPWLFVPLVAERDGHAFVAAAVAAGASATLASRPVDAGSAAVIQVEDTERALMGLGAAARDRLDAAALIAITGSVGKTTTKDLLAGILSRDRVTHANLRSFNNEIGVPLTLLGAPDDAGAVVVEMGARGLDHISLLCGIARPTIGIVTTVGAAHTSEFGDVASVARGKRELVEALPPAADGGVAVLNADVELVAAMADHTDAKVVSFGHHGEVRAVEVVLDEHLVPSFRLVSPWGEQQVRLGARGEHLVSAALAAAAASLSVGVSLANVAEGLSEPQLSPMRMDLQRTEQGTAVLNDAYNANPLSMAAALRSLAALPASRRVAVIGVMAELGAQAEAEHRSMVSLAEQLGIEVIAVDAPDYGEGVRHVTGVDQALDALGSLRAQDAVLIKGSRVAALERVAHRLLD